MTLLMIAFGLLWGHLLRIRPTQSVFISTCLSLSSTPLVSRFLVGSARGDKEGRWWYALMKAHEEKLQGSFFSGISSGYEYSGCCSERD
jgi:hypothetical protein